MDETKRPDTKPWWSWAKRGKPKPVPHPSLTELLGRQDAEWRAFLDKAAPNGDHTVVTKINRGEAGIQYTRVPLAEFYAQRHRPKLRLIQGGKK